MLTKPLTAKAWAESIEKDIDVEDRDADFGFVGDVKSIDPTLLLLKLQEDHCIPVIAPIGTDREGNVQHQCRPGCWGDRGGVEGENW